jgi:RNA polymerase-binding transcription factor DksA
VQAIQEHIERRLREAREELVQLDGRLESRGDYGLGKGDPMIVRWELNLALRDRTEQKVGQLEDAMERLREGDYGCCESCGQMIDPERLEALPSAELCISCAREAQRHNRAVRPSASGHSSRR